ncbi:NB-ARC domain-containing protein [Actinosynnema sp. NPDC023587]|uniref:NB-ARC domain-containing protein n=1 Tax=Actinosynnema sp. NPDC023587 TaxID=3154695 RepID=UPI0033C06237
MWRRWWSWLVVGVPALAVVVTTTLVAVSVNVFTELEVPLLGPVREHPLRWVLGTTAVLVLCTLLVWWGQRSHDRRLGALVPAEQRPEPWVVDRPAPVRRVVAALCRRGGVSVGITTALSGAGGFGKTTVAKLVRADRRVLRRFGGGVYWVTLGRDVRTPAAIAAKVNDLLARVAPGTAVAFTDPQQAGEYLTALVASGPRRLLVLDDVWYPEQEAAFRVGGRCARLVTTRIPSLVAGAVVPVEVDEMTPAQARALLTAGLPPLPPELVEGLLAVTRRWPLLLRLVNGVLLDQLRTAPDAVRVAEELLARLRDAGALHLDRLTGADGQAIDVDDPRQRQSAVAATIEAGVGLLTAAERARFAELGIFAEDEAVPVAVVGALWEATGGLDLVATRALCARLAALALLTTTGTADGGAVGLHDVVRDFLRRELGAARLTELHGVLLDAVARDLPLGDGGNPAWWELPGSARYLWDHLVEHLVAAERVDEAEALASDLRWVFARLERSGPAAPYTDLSRVDTPRSARLRRVLGQTAHLLVPTDPAHSRLDVLLSRVAHDPHWGPQAAALTAGRTEPRLVNRLSLPDLPHPALRLTLEEQAIAVAAGDTWLATVDFDGVVRVRDPATGTVRTEFTAHPRPAQVAVAGTRLVAVGHDGTVRGYDLPTGAPGAVLTKGRDRRRRLSELAVAPDGTWFVTGDVDGVVRVWDSTTGAQRTELVGHTALVRAVAVAPDGSWLVTAGDEGTVHAWDPATGAVRVRFPDQGVRTEALAIAPDGTWFATGDSDGVVRVRDPATGAVRVEFTAHPGSVTAVATDGTWLATAGLGGSLRLWDPVTGVRRAELEGHVRLVATMSVSPDGSWLATAGQDRTARVWDVPTTAGEDEATGGADVVRAVAVSPDGSWIVTGGQDGVVRVREFATGVVRVEFDAGARRAGPGDGDPVAGVAVSPDGVKVIVTHASGPVWTGDPVTGVDHPWAGERVDPTRVVSPDGAWIATAATGRTVLIQDLASGGQRTLAMNGYVHAVAVSPDGTALITGEAEGAVEVWDVATGERRAELAGHTGPVNAVAVSPDGRWLASCASDRTVRVWDLLAGRPRALMRVDSTALACAWSPDGGALVVGTGSGLCVFDFHPSPAG